MSAPRILVADDDTWILKMVTTVLEKRGYAVETAHDGEEAYQKALANPPNLLITDVMMPKMDGWTLVRVLRSRREFAFVPVIFLTALGSDDDRIRGFRLGADDYLSKPFRFEELDLRVTKTLKRSELVEMMARERISSAMQATAAESPAASKPPEQHARPAPTGESPPLSGNLRQVGLSALLTLLEMERKTGVLLLAHDDGIPIDGEDAARGRIEILDGRCQRARIDGRPTPVNEECIYLMLEWAGGHFEFQNADVRDAPEIKSSTTHILMEGARRLDERNAG